MKKPVLLVGAVAVGAVLVLAMLRERGDLRTASTLSHQREALQPIRDSSADRRFVNPVEASYLAGNHLSVRARAALAEPAFAQIMRDFDFGNAGQYGTRTSDYREQVEGLLEAYPAGQQLVQLSCASNLCIGEFISKTDTSWLDTWGPAMLAKGALPVDSLELNKVPLKGGGVDIRFAFTTKRT